MIPILDLRAATDEIRDELQEALGRVAASGWYIGGEEVAAFEEAFAAYCGVAHCVGVGNGFDALHLTLRAFGIGAGDEVIVASNSYIATVLAVTMVGANPIAVEPDPNTHNLDVAKVEQAITPKTRAILPTHLYGQPAELGPLLELARRHGLRLIEDAAQAHGARHDGRRIGGHGDAVCWSFYPSKNLGAVGDAGAVTTNDAEAAKKIRMMGNYGSSTRYVNEMLGVNSRLDPIQAAVLRVKLRHLDEWNARRAAIAEYYLRELRETRLRLPTVAARAEPVWHQFVIGYSRRDQLQKELQKRGVSTLIHYPIPPHRQAAYAGTRFAEQRFPVAERLATEVLSLPIGPHLSSEQAAQIVDALKQSMAKIGD